MNDLEKGQALNNGKALELFRKNVLNMGIYEFADYLGIKPSHLLNVEQGRKFDDTPKVEKPCETCNGTGEEIYWTGAGASERKTRKCPDCQPQETEFDLWEKVNKESGEDIISIVMDMFHQRINPSKTMDRIVRRCKITAKVFTSKLEAENERLRTALKIARDHIGYEGDCVEQAIQKEIKQILKGKLQLLKQERIRKLTGLNDVNKGFTGKS